MFHFSSSPFLSKSTRRPSNRQGAPFAPVDLTSTLFPMRSSSGAPFFASLIIRRGIRAGFKDRTVFTVRSFSLSSMLSISRREGYCVFHTLESVYSTVAVVPFHAVTSPSYQAHSPSASLSPKQPTTRTPSSILSSGSGGTKYSLGFSEYMNVRDFGLVRGASTDSSHRQSLRSLSSFRRPSMRQGPLFIPLDLTSSLIPIFISLGASRFASLMTITAMFSASMFFTAERERTSSERRTSRSWR
mmetsp:Transcript_30052/g.41887  ORF Transcript_30052/g.41887 Transcript_30052/m.41887 type:complete len:244 (+) Transcript_30052:592-1323(+)